LFYFEQQNLCVHWFRATFSQPRFDARRHFASTRAAMVRTRASCIFQKARLAASVPRLKRE
jgi:hypothetical protein